MQKQEGSIYSPLSCQKWLSPYLKYGQLSKPVSTNNEEMIYHTI